MVKILLFIILISALAGGNESSKSPKGKIIIEVVELENSNGTVLSQIFKDEEKFPTISNYAFAFTKSKPKNKKATLIYENIPYGTWAISIHHDANDNNKMDRSWIGYPTEGWGVSNDAEAIIGPPSFDESKFILDKPVHRLKITMRYL